MNQLEQSILKGLWEEPYCLYVRNAGVYRFPSSYRFNAHRHQETEIAARTGFHSSQYFSRAFLNHTGMKPTQYRELWKGRGAEELCRIEKEEEI